MDIGEKIKFLRRLKGLNQTQLAEQSKVSLPYINQIEKGKADAVSDAIYEQIAAALGVPLNDIKDSQKGFKIGFQPSIWSVQLLSMLINRPSVEARISYTYNSETQNKEFFALNDKNEVKPLITVNGDEFRKPDKKVNDIGFISERELIDGLYNQEYDFIFAPVTYNSDAGLSSIANICSTVQGGIYAVVFPNNPEEMGWKNNLKFDKNSAVTNFLAKYKDNGQWDKLFKNSFFYYQQESISEYIVNEIIGNVDIDSEKRIELKNESVIETVHFMMDRLVKMVNTLNKGKNTEIVDFIAINSDGGTFNYNEPLLKMVNVNSEYNLEKSLNEDQNNAGDNFSIYIGWEPYVSKLIDEYAKRFKEKYYCLSFNVNQFLRADDPAFILNYECFIKADKIEAYKKNEDVKKFFLELDSTIKRLNKLSQSKSISPEINIIAELLGLKPKNVMDIIKKINFSLKFYPHWCY